MRIVWDERKRLTNIERHGLDFAAVADLFDFAGAIVQRSYRGRLLAIGDLDGMLVAIALRPLGTEGLSLISLRPASAKERKLHAQRQKDLPAPDR